MASLTTNMNLVVPVVGVEVGPDWATDINADLGILDQHNHSAGQGVQITPTGLNINADLPINSNNLTTVKTVNFHNLSATLTGASPNLGALYVAGGELIYNDESGNVVSITKTGNVNAGAGSITGLPSGTASASFGAGTFVWQASTNTPANMDFGSGIFRNNLANSKGLTLSPPNSMASDYSLVLPALPGSTQLMTLDASGNMGTQTQITTAQITDLAVTTAKIANNAVTPGKLAALGQQISGSSGSFNTTSNSSVDITNCSVTITTTGRPVFVGLMAFDGTDQAYVELIATGTVTTINGAINFDRSGTPVGLFYVGLKVPAGELEYYWVPGSAYWRIDTPTAGTYTYKAQAFVFTANTKISAFNLSLIAYEL